MLKSLLLHPETVMFAKDWWLMRHNWLIHLKTCYVTSPQKPESSERDMTNFSSPTIEVMDKANRSPLELLKFVLGLTFRTTRHLRFYQTDQR